MPYTVDPTPTLSVSPRPRVRRDPAGHWRVLVSGMPELTLRYDTWDRAMEAALSVARSLRNLLPPPPAPVIPWVQSPEPPTQPLRMPTPAYPRPPQIWWEPYRGPA